MDNPNEYDDAAFTEASTEFQGNTTEMFDQLWNAGCSLADIQSEIANALENTEFGEDYSFRVLITESQ